MRFCDHRSTDSVPRRNLSGKIGRQYPARMATPQIPGGQCPHCGAPLIDLFAEWTDDYQTAVGKQDILAGEIVFDCTFCEGPVQLVLPLALVLPRKLVGDYRVAKR